MGESNSDKLLETILAAFDARFAQLDSKIEAMSLHAVPKFQSSSDDSARGGGEGADFLRSPTDSSSRPKSDRRPSRYSFGSSESQSSQDVVVRNVNSSFRLDKPKFEFPSDTKNDGAFDESVLKFIDDCNRHIEMWLNLPENKHKEFEGSDVFALVTLPASIQKRVAHNLEMIFEKSEVTGWSLDQIQQAKLWRNATTSEVKQSILVRKAQGVAMKDAVKSIQPPAISWPTGTGFIHLDAFEEYKSKMTTQVARLSEGGVSLSFIAIKDAIISAVPDRDFKIEMYTQFGHSGSLPGPNASGVAREFSMKDIFDFIRAHIMIIKKKGLAQMVNKNSVSFVSTPQTLQKFGSRRPFASQPASRVQAIEFHSEFPSSDHDFWMGDEQQQSAERNDDEYTHVNTAVQSARSKECRFKGVGPDGKVLCPYLGNPETAKCGFLHPTKELELKGKGVSRATPGQPKKVHTLTQGLEVSYDGERESSDSESNDA
jgi:hypothetical protein